jgi:uncharacterized PurR-regulated membrane protein YhhQ (DUF165 family)
MTIVMIIVYLAAIVAANLLVVAFGPSVVIANAFLFIGLDLVARDKLHEAWQGRRLMWRMGLLILTGSLLSYLLNRDAGPIALASFVAFLLMSIADWLVFRALRHRPWLVRSNGSNLVGALIDSLVFPTLAFGALLPAIVIGQFLAKAAGGFVWSWLLKRD